jgi:uncharacterized membrane protein SpoIIM required for sporulation
MSAAVAQGSPALKSSVFRREREATWRELEALVKIVEKKGLKRLTAEQTLRLPALYRQTLSSLSVARATSLDAALLAYLEALSARAYLAIYGVNAGFAASIWDVLWRRVPAAVRSGAGCLLLATLIFGAGVLVAYALVTGNADWYYSFMPADMAADRTPTASDEALRASIYGEAGFQVGEMQIFASRLFSHNAGIGLLSFALGFAFGVPTMLLMFYNGCTLGAFIALYAGRGLGVDVGGWLFVHGTTEISAILICGGAGLVIGRAVAFPGRLTRLDNLAQSGRSAAMMLVGAVIMLFTAAFLEGYARQLVDDMPTRYAIVGIMFAIWMFWFLAGGRRGNRHRTD